MISRTFPRFAALSALIVGVACVARSSGGATWATPDEAAERPNPQTADPASIVRGKAVYTVECLPCHGEHGRGDGPDGFSLDPSPSDLTADRVVRQRDGTLFFRISEGHEGMPPFAPRLSDEQRWAVVNYLRSLATISTSFPPNDPRQGGRR